MNKHLLSTVGVVAMVLSVANFLTLVAGSAGVVRLATPNVPQLINYQSRLTDAVGNSLTGG